MGARRWRWIWQQGGSSELLSTNSCRFRLTDSSLEQMVWPDIPETRFIASTQEKFSSRLRCLAADFLWPTLFPTFCRFQIRHEDFRQRIAVEDEDITRYRNPWSFWILRKVSRQEISSLNLFDTSLWPAKGRFSTFLWSIRPGVFLRLFDHRKRLFPKVGNGTMFAIYPSSLKLTFFITASWTGTSWRTQSFWIISHRSRFVTFTFIQHLLTGHQKNK